MKRPPAMPPRPLPPPVPEYSGPTLLEDAAQGCVLLVFAACVFVIGVAVGHWLWK